jgi:hypothetical protein
VQCWGLNFEKMATFFFFSALKKCITIVFFLTVFKCVVSSSSDPEPDHPFFQKVRSGSDQKGPDPPKQ